VPHQSKGPFTHTLRLCCVARCCALLRVAFFDALLRFPVMNIHMQKNG